MIIRLKIGDVLKLTGGLFHVIRVSGCSATIVPKDKIRRMFTDRRTGRPVMFHATGHAAIIAPKVEESLLAHPVQKAAP